MIDLDALEKLAAKATPWPWFVTCNCTGKTFYTIKNDRVYIGETLGVYNGEANAAYIAAACNAVPELIARVRELELTVKFILHKHLSPEESTDCDLRGIPCPHRYGRWWCTADEDERVSCHVRAAIKAAKEAGE